MELPSISLQSYHNAAIAVYHEGRIITVLEFERFVNLKNASHDFFQPIYARDYILQHAYEYLKDKFGFTEYNKFIVGFGYPEIPQKHKDSFPAKEYLIDESHHSAHAYGSFAQSPFEKSLIISFDGGSNEGYFNFYIGERGQDLMKVKSLNLDLGSHYHAIGSICEEIKHYDSLTTSGKVLGLQSYGVVIEEWKKPLKEFFSFQLPYWTKFEERKKSLLADLGFNTETVVKLSGQDSYNLCRTAQEVFEELFFENANSTILEYNLPIILTGGCALNIVLNTRVKERYDLDVFVAPNSTDCGIAAGLLCKQFKPVDIVDITYKGVDVLDKHTLIEYTNSRYGAKTPLQDIIEDLAQNKILGVVQGNAEHGPRALGNRSIICSPLSPDMKDTLNLKVKHREWFRPFAPIVRLEDVSEYFEWEGESRWMNFCPKVKPGYIDKIPAVVHVDGTARVQTVTREQNPFIYDLLTEFKEKTGIGVLVNTSFNVDGKPILSTYKDAFKVFDETQLDRLYLDGYYFRK